MDSRQMYSMKLNDSIQFIDEYCRIIRVLRVPSGWIYTVSDIPIFVPYDNFFQPTARGIKND